jgi:hypothetical protein
LARISSSLRSRDPARRSIFASIRSISSRSRGVRPGAERAAAKGRCAFTASFAGLFGNDIP